MKKLLLLLSIFVTISNAQATPLNYSAVKIFDDGYTTIAGEVNISATNAFVSFALPVKFKAKVNLVAQFNSFIYNNRIDFCTIYDMQNVICYTQYVLDRDATVNFLAIGYK